MTLHEPATFLTDCLLGGISALAAWRLAGRAAPEDRATPWFQRGFVLSSASAFVGGAYHGFATNFPAAVAGAWWRLTLVLLVLTATALELSLRAELAPGRESRWRTLIGAKLAVSLVTVLADPRFIWALVAYGIALTAWTVAAAAVRRKWSRSILLGVGLSVLAAAAQISRWDPSARFNHNDLYHVIQALALLALFRAASRLQGAAVVAS